MLLVLQRQMLALMVMLVDEDAEWKGRGIARMRGTVRTQMQTNKYPDGKTKAERRTQTGRRETRRSLATTVNVETTTESMERS